MKTKYCYARKITSGYTTGRYSAMVPWPSVSLIHNNSPQKAPHHQLGTIYATTHRLFYIDSAHSFTRSFSLDLAHVARTEHYAGLFTSSPKITLYLHPPPSRPVLKPSDVATNISQTVGSPVTSSEVEYWECEVCSNRNPIGLTSSASLVCSLCGVPRASMKAPINIRSKAPSASHSLSSSLPSSSLALSRLAISASPSPSPPVPAPPVPASNSNEVACIACTFLNSSLLTECEICGTRLPRKPSLSVASSHPPAKSAPASRSATPAPDEDEWSSEDDTPEKRMIRISFRKGGDKPFYSVLRRSLLGKAWEVRMMRSLRFSSY